MDTEIMNDLKDLIRDLLSFLLEKEVVEDTDIEVNGIHPVFIIVGVPSDHVRKAIGQKGMYSKSMRILLEAFLSRHFDSRIYFNIMEKKNEKD